MLMLRFQRTGKSKQPSYRLIVSPKTRDTQAGSLEILGYYNPLTNPPTVTLEKERITYWLSVGAQCSATVHNLLVTSGIIKDKKRKVVTITKKRHAELEKKKTETATA